MSIDDYLKSIDYEVKVKVLGELKNFKYYIQDDLPNDEEVGEPLVVMENKKQHTFEVLGSDQANKIILLFTE